MSSRHAIVIEATKKILNRRCDNHLSREVGIGPKRWVLARGGQSRNQHIGFWRASTNSLCEHSLVIK
jgi:hypothetical protein